MTSFTFSAEQLRSAPPEVRRWVADQVGQALGGLAAPHAETPRRQPQQEERLPLAACTPPEVLQIFELIGNDPIVGRLFFELARDSRVNSGMAGVHVLRTADLMRHAGLSDGDALMTGLTAIDRAFRQVHGQRPGNLFGFVDPGHLYVHEQTQASIRRVWEELMRARAAAEQQAAAGGAAAPHDFIPPHLGPSEDVATHAPHTSSGGNFPF